MWWQWDTGTMCRSAELGPVVRVIFIVGDVEAGLEKGVAALAVGLEIGDGVAALDAVADAHVVRVGGIVGRFHDPFG